MRSGGASPKVPELDESAATCCNITPAAAAASAAVTVAVAVISPGDTVMYVSAAALLHQAPGPSLAL